MFGLASRVMASVVTARLSTGFRRTLGLLVLVVALVGGFLTP